MDISATEFLSSRRSTPPRTLIEPAPQGDELDALFRQAMRVPDHGKLTPWHLIALGPKTRAALREPLRAHGLALGLDEAKAEKAASSLTSPLVVGVVFAPRAEDKIPRWEQAASASCVCLSLVNACLASGWGASWLSGPICAGDFAQRHLGLAAEESLMGAIHIGTVTHSTPERPRPVLEDHVTRLP